MKNLFFWIAFTLPQIALAKSDYVCPVVNSDPLIKSEVSIQTARNFDAINYPMTFKPGITSMKLQTTTLSSKGQVTGSTEELLYEGGFLGGLAIDPLACGFFGGLQNEYDGLDKTFRMAAKCNLKASTLASLDSVSLMMTLTFASGGKILIDVVGDHPSHREILLGTCD